MIEKWKKAVDNRNVSGALLTDLSKAFDCLPHDLIILFNIFLSGLFVIVGNIDIANYADDNTIYKEYENIDDLITSLQDANGFLTTK